MKNFDEIIDYVLVFFRNVYFPAENQHPIWGLTVFPKTSADFDWTWNKTHTFYRRKLTNMFYTARRKFGSASLFHEKDADERDVDDEGKQLKGKIFGSKGKL